MKTKEQSREEKETKKCDFCKIACGQEWCSINDKEEQEDKNED